MRASFRAVQYLIDPFLGDRITVAAIVQEGGRSQLVRAEVPCARCVGGPRHLAASRMALGSIERALEGGDAVPEVSPFVTISHPRDIPDGVDTERWVREYVLPRRLVHE